MFVFFAELGFSDGNYCWFKGPIKPLLMKQKVEYLFTPFVNSSSFYNYEDLLGFCLGYTNFIIISFIGFTNNI
jgi:hypothetical protein